MLVDLCRGPHLRHTGQIGGLKLLTVSCGDGEVETPICTGVAGEWEGNSGPSVLIAKQGVRGRKILRPCLLETESDGRPRSQLSFHNWTWMQEEMGWEGADRLDKVLHGRLLCRGAWVPFDRHGENTLSQGRVFYENTLLGKVVTRENGSRGRGERQIHRTKSAGLTPSHLCFVLALPLMTSVALGTSPYLFPHL